MVRRPHSEYWLENEAEKSFLELENNAKLRLLFYPAQEPNEDTKNIIFYSGFISYVFLWWESLEILRKNHNIYFIETREKEYSSFPPDDITYSVETLGDDFRLSLAKLNLDLKICIFAGSSIASDGVLEAMSEYRIHPYLSVLSSPQPHYPGNDKVKLMGKIFPIWLITILKPIIYLVFRIRFRRDKRSGTSRIHTLSRMFQKKQLKWMRNLKSFMPPYQMKKENVKNIDSPVVIVGAQDDPEHDTSSIEELEKLIPGAKYRPVPFKKDTHNECYAQIILEEFEKVKNGDF